MKKRNGSKIVEIVALIVAVVGLTVGFSAYSSSLKFVEKFDVKDDDFQIYFSASDIYHDDFSEIKAVVHDGALAEDAVIDKDERGNVVTNLKAKFTDSGQKVVYTFYSYNKSNYDAFLRNITFENVYNENSFKVCRPVDSKSTNNNLISKACEDISLTVDVGGVIRTNGSINKIDNHSLLKGTKEPITVTIEYDEDGVVADCEFAIEFGEIVLNYYSVNEIINENK